MKAFLTFCVILFSITYSIKAQEHKIFVSEDTFVQGGNTSGEVMGVNSKKQLRVGNSNANNKYARITYLKFAFPKRIKRMQEVALHIPLKVFSHNEDSKVKFKLDVYTVENNEWSENTLTWDTKLDVNNLVGSAELPKSEGKESTWCKIVLNTYPIFKLANSQKHRTITLALMNTEFNKTSSISPSKEKSESFTTYLTIE